MKGSSDSTPKNDDQKSRGDGDGSLKRKKSRVLDSILQHIGQTPLVRLHSIPVKAGLACEMYAKCEFFNAGGSIKDRIGLEMITQAERQGRIAPGDTLIEPTSGNTGIGIALGAALKGYRCLITLPEKMSDEKVNVLKALGAEIIRTPTDAAWDSPESHIGVAQRLHEEIPHSHILDQYRNPANPNAHYEYTAEEILEQLDGQIDMLVAGVGTGGTITGVAKKLKEKCPNVYIVGVDPEGSILAVPESLNDVNRLTSYQVEGIGYDFIPSVLDRSLVDAWFKTTDQESFIMSRRLIREEGLLCGGSCGAAMVGALKAASTLKAGQKCVVVLPDSTRNYMTKFLNDHWMSSKGFVPHAVHSTDNYKKFRKEMTTWWSEQTVAALQPTKPVTITPNVTCKEAVELMENNSFDQLPVVAAMSSNSKCDMNRMLGVVTIGNLLAKLASGTLNNSNSVAQAMFKRFFMVTQSTKLAEVAERFDTDYYAIVVSEGKIQEEEVNGHKQQKKGKDQVNDDEVDTAPTIVGIVTRMDLLAYITSREDEKKVG